MIYLLILRIRVYVVRQGGINITGYESADLKMKDYTGSYSGPPGITRDLESGREEERKDQTSGEV